MITNQQLPSGFAMQLAQNMESMTNFAKMSDSQKAAVIEQAKNVKSHNEMKAIVEGLSKTY